MGVSLKIDGVDWLRDQLKKLPADLMHEATAIVHVTAITMQNEVLAVYPLGPGSKKHPPGNLRKGVSVNVEQTDRAGITAWVRTRAQHAWWFEHGTNTRAWKNGKNVGAMPASNAFIPIAIARRRVMTRALIGVVERAGLSVSGSSV